MIINKNKANNGITLIALVITIIVLLILAGVTIATLMGDNGILTKANDAKRETEIAEVKERAQLDIASWVADKMQNGEDSTVDTPDLVKSILDTANPDADNRYYKDVTDEGVVTPNDYIVPIEELYTNGTGGGSGTGDVEAGDEVSEKPGDWTSDKVKPIADGEDGVIPLPDGFYYVGGTKSDGIVISDDPADAKKGTSWEVAQTLQGNQFVWIPVENDAYFQRYDGYYDGNFNDGFVEACEEPYSGGYATEPAEYNAMKTSVLQYNGFYVGRYEAGTTADSGTGIRGDLVIKQGANVYNNIKWGNSMTDATGGAVEISKNFDTERGYTSVTSTLIYGVQWDAIMQFIDSGYRNEDGTLTSYVAGSTGKGNYDEEENTNPWRGNVTVTGASADYAVKNIYDLAGNCWEWTMESCNTYRRSSSQRSAITTIQVLTIQLAVVATTLRLMLTITVLLGSLYICKAEC